DQPDFAGEMTITWHLADAAGGTEVTVLCEDIPTGIRLEDNELGSRSSLQKLAAFIERTTGN
ncbi:MAG TPA: SRPBCC domain-containing protein, partial [Chloroflexia bacterium]